MKLKKPEVIFAVKQRATMIAAYLQGYIYP